MTFYENWKRKHLSIKTWGTLVQPTIDRLLTARANGKFPQSLILIGPPRLGRELVALTVAASLTCPESGHAGCRCGSCRRVFDAKHPDVMVLSPEGAKQQIGINPIRDIVKKAPGRPYEANRRVWILDGVEAGCLGAEAANAFLKTLEEPPAHVVFILLAGNPTGILPTIRSRCQKLALPGSVAVAQQLCDETVPPELAQLALEGAPVQAMQVRTEEALEAALKQNVTQIMLLARDLAGAKAGFEILASTALDLAAKKPQYAETMVRLAADALVIEKRMRELNLNPDRQMMSCLMKWFDCL